jgi:hypothetical protein
MKDMKRELKTLRKQVIKNKEDNEREGSDNLRSIQRLYKQGISLGFEETI